MTPPVTPPPPRRGRLAAFGAACALAAGAADSADPGLIAAGVGVLAAAACAVGWLRASARTAAAEADRRVLANELRATNRRLRDQEGEITRRSGALRLNEARQRAALRTARMVAWEWNTRTGEMRATDPPPGWPPTCLPGTVERWLGLVHPDDRDRVRRAVGQAATRGDWEGEFRLLFPGGREVWVRTRGQRVADEAGKPTDWVGGVMADVTDRRAADDRLRLLESAVVHARDGVVVLDAGTDGDRGRRVRYANDAFCAMTGYGRADVVGRSLHFLRGPDTDPATLDRMRAALDAGAPLQVELQNHRKDGAAFWVELSLVPVRDSAGGVAHWVMIQRDVSDRKRADAALRRSEELFRGIFEGAPAGVSLTGTDGRFVSCNPAFAAMLGRPAEEVIGLAPGDVTHPADWAAQRAEFDAARSGSAARSCRLKRYVRPDGEEVWAEMSFTPVFGPDGRYEYGLGVSVNVTQRRRLEEQLWHAQKMEAVGQMAGGVAHDFNNLLTAVVGNLALVNLPPDDPNRPLLMAVEQAAGRAADLTRKLLGYARRNQLLPAAVDPRDPIDEVVALLRRTFDPRVEIRTDVAPGCGPVLADPTLLNQAVMNLCLNARDAMPGGGRLTLSAAPAEVTANDLTGRPGARPGGFVRVSVADTGAGMTDEVKGRIFEPFFTTKGVGKGTGLGLPMVRGVVEQHGGWVEFETEPGAGTRFDLYFPAADPVRTPPPRVVHRGRADGGPADAARTGIAHRPLPRPDAAPPPPPADLWLPDLPPAALPDLVEFCDTLLPEGTLAPDPSPPEPAGGDGRTVLLVDDEDMIRSIGRVVLERAGFRVLTADDGVEAVEAFRAHHAAIDLVVLDVTMPRMSGLDAFRHMAGITPHPPVLFSTGYSADDVSGANGALGLLSKPYRPHELLAAVRDALAVTGAATA